MAAEQDLTWMRAAIEVASEGIGWTSPRPCVGCLIVKDGVELGRGRTCGGHGTPHGEVAALQDAADQGHDVRGATAYVTMEPCCHHGTTPPCTDALVAAGIARVVCGVTDPNPLVSGKGIACLIRAGIEVEAGILHAECSRLHEQFLTHVLRRTPFITLKLASSLDGKTATSTGASKWISGEGARSRVHEMRHEHDAVLVGIETVLADDPMLDVRLPGKRRNPVRIVLDSSARTPLNSQLVRTLATSSVIVATTRRAPDDRVQALADAGVEVISAPSGPDGRVDLSGLMHRLYEKEISSVLVEGGSRVAGAFLHAGMVDRLTLFMSPMVLGEGKPLFAGYETPSLAAASRLSDLEVEKIGGDLMISGRFTA